MNIDIFTKNITADVSFGPGDPIPNDVVNMKDISYINIPCAFDIETTSTYNDAGEKIAFMYEWTFGINGVIFIGRTWDQFMSFIDRVINTLHVSLYRRLIVYVHNLSYEFQFIRKRFDWLKVFSIDRRKPIYAVSDTGIEFRCSYLLSGYNLAKLGDNLQTFRFSKMVGNLDYSLIRHDKTVLSPEELKYCINDVKIVMGYIAELIMANKAITNIPLTKTGFVRKYCRKKCFSANGDISKLRYRDMMKRLVIAPNEYKQLKRGFQGGFTHAGIFYTNRTINDITSFDFTSSYPSVMISEKFPMSSSERISIKSEVELNRNLKYYCCLFDVEITNIRARILFENYISRSRCYCENPVINNGRLVSADRIITTVTEQDFLIISKFYEWDNIKISNFRRYKKDFLPKDFVISILDLYGKKTYLKGVEGKEAEYLNSKEMLNSCYGMSVTDPVRTVYPYSDKWDDPVRPDIEYSIEKYNQNRTRFLFYPWGVWVTAYARRNLFSGIMEFAGDYVYSDTDSIKGKNAEKHAEYIEQYNKRITERIEKILTYRNIPVDMARPKTVKGIEKPLGIWEYDGNYKQFKTLGAKRYLVEYSNDPRNGDKRGKIELTVSGVNKKCAIPYLLNTFGDTIFDHFTNDLYIPAEYTGKNTHTYIDDPISGEILDYQNNVSRFDELSSIHLEKSDYSLSLSREYIEYITNTQEADEL